MNRLINRREIKISNNNPPTMEIIVPDGFGGEIYKKFKELTPILPKLFQKIEAEGTVHISFYEASITLIPKPDQDTTRKPQHNNSYAY